MTSQAGEVLKGLCPVCEREATIRKVSRRETLVVRNEPIEFEAEVRRCDACGDVFASVEEEERNFEKVYRAFRKKHGLLQPEEIRRLREQYGLGQRAFSRLLGWGEITIHRYEAGALQDEAHNNELLLLKDPAAFEVLFERNKHKLSPGVSRRVERQLRELLGERKQNQLKRWLGSLFGESREDILSGYRWFDLERFENLVLYFCKSISPVTKTKLNKLLWYCDFLSFNVTGRSMTGLVYVHLPYGPVPSHYEYYLGHLIQEEVLSSKEVIFGEGVTGEVYEAVEEPDLSLFTDQEKAVMDKVAQLFMRMGAKAIADLSHAEEGYRRTAPGEAVSYEWAEHLQIDL